MPPILIQPDNRLLGSASDLSLHGGQPLPGMAIGRPADWRPEAQDSAKAETPEAIAAKDAAPPAVNDGGSTAAAGTVPAPVMPAFTIEQGHVTATPSVGDSVFSSGATAPSTLFFAPGHAQGQPAPEAHAASLTAPAAADGALTAPLFQQAAGVDHAVQHVTGDLPQLAAVTEALGQVTDMLDGIAGINPAAGIETIVDLMKTADVFELRATTSDVIDHGTAPVLDTLAFDITEASPLLGDHDTHHDGDGLLGGLDTHHGLPGLG